jgi:hypothetical protein
MCYAYTCISIIGNEYIHWFIYLFITSNADSWYVILSRAVSNPFIMSRVYRLLPVVMTICDIEEGASEYDNE